MNYDDLLNKSWDEIPEPQLLPGGGWMVEGRNVALVKPKEDGQALKVLFSYKAKEPVAVDEEALAELGEGYDIAMNDLTYTVYVETAADLDKVRKHLAIHGIDVNGGIFGEDGKLSFAKAFRGTEVVATIGQRSYENNAGETVWQNTLSGFQKAE